MWRVYYEDGTTRNWTDGTDGMPIYGVLAVLQTILYKTDGGTGYQITHGCPYYALYNGQWLHFFESDLVDHITHDKQIDKLLVGRMVSKQVFGDMWERVQHDKNAENL